MESTELTQSYLKSILHYDKNTGIFTWRVSRTNSIKIGDVAGTKTLSRYLQIGIRMQSITKRYYAHRLVWLHEYGEWPEQQIDHINHDKTDNRIANLREANDSLNRRNASKRKANTSGFNGIYWNKKLKKWLSKIQVNGKQINLGTFADKNEAICARLHANKLYGFHKNHGKDMK